MARRKRSSGFEDAMTVVAMLPWWGGLILAVFSYVLLHRLAQPPVFQPSPLGLSGSWLGASLVSALAFPAQFIVPVICVFGALGSFLARGRRQRLVGTVSQSKSASALEEMSWREFEMLVGEAFRLQGYRVAEMGGAGPDGGIDLVLTKGSEKFLVQCKQWKAFKVGVTVVRELYGVMAAKGAAGGFVVTSGNFTADATAFASGRNIKLIDGPLLHGLIQQAKQAKSAASVVPHPAFGSRPAQPASMPNAAPMPVAHSVPTCPTCGAQMAKRKAKRGSNAGGEFWGCGTYPACKGTRAI
jgi:restriction system protein